MSKHFTDGVYYVQDITLKDEGVHTINVWIESQNLGQVKPFTHDLHIHQFMRLQDEPFLLSGPYGPLRKVVDPIVSVGESQELNWQDNTINKYLKKAKHSLRVVDAKVAFYFILNLL